MTVFAGVQGTHTFLGDMLMLALADVDERPLEPGDLYLNEIVSDCARAARILGTPRQVTNDVSGDAVDVPMSGDEGLLRQLVTPAFLSDSYGSDRRAPDAVPV